MSWVLLDPVTDIAGDQVLDGVHPSGKGEPRLREAHDFMPPSRPGPNAVIPKRLPLQKEIDALQLLRRVSRKSQALRYVGVGIMGNRRPILDHCALTAPVRL